VRQVRRQAGDAADATIRLPVKLGISIPTCKEGLSLPTPFCSPEEVVRLCVRAEELGFDSIWGNDHITPPQYVREHYPEPPNFYEPLTTLAFAAQATSRIRLGTSVLVLPMREPVYLAKTVATLDAFSGGRLTMGVGTGAYREEFERLRPRDKRLRRDSMIGEAIELIRRLFEERSVSFSGKHYQCEGIELAPKPAQRPLPMFMGGNNVNVIRRAARWGQGWYPAAIGADEVRGGIDTLQRFCDELGRDPREVEIALQLACGIGHTHEAGVAQFKHSRMYTHMHTLSASTLRDQNLARLEEVNLVGSPEEIVAKIARLEEIGVTMLASMSFTSNSYEETLDDMQLFAEEVLPAIHRTPAATA
jgi:probable F420-dependent oxidoreductase